MAKSLEDLIQAAGNPVQMLRNSQTGPNVYPGVPPEFTNWRDEQEAWQKTAVLFTLSFHMADLLVEGPDAQKLLSQLAVNSFAGFAVDKAKQFVPCTPDGYVIGDVRGKTERPHVRCEVKRRDGGYAASRATIFSTESRLPSCPNILLKIVNADSRQSLCRRWRSRSRFLSVD